ncbi:reverse transcriptase-like protein [Massilia sp. CCM 8733]|uniref:Reverse transcriptase-like protein n=1 Tax=Massilia mucilaginosa TaxID=2609282 RepID=A0ABX0NL38_9BURK|nr:ribonuclease HI family protein [Massilia mucilaginosa]NHZ87506.1 reverse transcriptase-like protein [Massilia mucilaginosa]
MTELTHLLAAAFKSERSASRKLAARAGISEEQALRATLEQRAGAHGLAHLLDQRAALAAMEAARLAARDARRARARSATAVKHDGPPSAWRAWFDGSAHPNPGRCGIGALLTGPAGQVVEIAQPAGYGNSSEAEYLALIAVLESALESGARGVSVHGDSRVVIDDVNGLDAAGAPSLRAYRVRAQALLARIDGACVRWLPRHKNQAADALSQRAVAAFRPADMA